MQTSCDVSVAPIHDAKAVERIISDPSVYPDMSDDSSAPPEAADGARLLAAGVVVGFLKGTELLGLQFFHQHNGVTWEVHTAVLPDGRGRAAIRWATLAFQFMFNRSDCRKIVTQVPTYNRAAYALARRVGMSVEGLNRSSFLKGGVLFDQHWLGMTEEDFKCR